MGAIHCKLLDTFRETWVCGHLDYQRADEDLEQARAAAGQVGNDVSDPERLQAEWVLRVAERRLSEVQASLIDRFDRFCGAPK